MSEHNDKIVPRLKALRQGLYDSCKIGAPAECWCPCCTAAFLIDQLDEPIATETTGPGGSNG